VRPAVQQGGKLGPRMLVLDARVGSEHSFDSLARVICAITQLNEVLEMAGDLTFVPSQENCFDVREVLVQSGSSDACSLRDLRHGDRPQPPLTNQRASRIERCLSHRLAVLIDGCAPELRHGEEVYGTSLSQHLVLYVDTMFRKVLRF
jgi:hypothetical protein